MNREERQKLNSQRKLYKRRVKDNKLLEIGYYRVACHPKYNVLFYPNWSLHCTHQFPNINTCYIHEVFTKESYYPGWLGETDNGELVDVPVMSSLEEIYVNCNEVVGFRNKALDWS